MNKNFGKVNNGEMSYAPDALYNDYGVIVNPSKDDYYKANEGPYLPNEDTLPAPDVGYHVSSWRWDTDGEKNYKVYDYEKDARPPRVFSKLKLELVLFNLGLLDALDAFVDSQTIENEMGQKMPLRRAYNTANEFSEDNEYFAPYLGFAKEALGVDDAVVDEILNRCVVEV